MDQDHVIIPSQQLKVPLEVKPFVPCVFYRSVVQVKPVDIDDCTFFGWLNDNRGLICAHFGINFLAGLVDLMRNCRISLDDSPAFEPVGRSI
jgi:hypothetical protein